IGASALFAGSEAVACGPSVEGEAVQATRSSAPRASAPKGAAALPRRQPRLSNRPRLTTSPIDQSPISICSGRSASIQARSSPRCSIQPRTRTLRPARAFNKTRRRESALVSFQDRNRNITRPPPPEIDKDCRPVFPYGRDFALDQRKLASMRQHVPRQLGVEHLIIRIGP